MDVFIYLFIIAIYIKYGLGVWESPCLLKSAEPLQAALTEELVEGQQGQSFWDTSDAVQVANSFAVRYSECDSKAGTGFVLKPGVFHTSV